MASAGEQTNKAIMDLLKKMVEAMERHMKDVAQQKAASKQYAFACAIDKYINEGGQVKGYFLNDDKLFNKHFKEELKANELPFIEYSINGQSIIAIRDCDEEKYKQIESMTQKNEQRYFQIVDKKDMAETFEASQRIPDKDKRFLTMDNVDKTMAQMIANKCNDITKGFMVGAVEHGDTTDLMVHAKRTIVLGTPQTDKVYSQDFCRAYLAAAFSGYGPNREKNIEQLKVDEELNKKIKDFKGPGEMWITGQDDTDTIIHVTEKGFDRIAVKPALDQNNEQTFVYEIQERHNALEENYREKLDVALAGIFDEVIVPDQASIDRHILGVEKQHSERPQKNMDERRRSYEETLVCNRADYLIKETLAKTPFFKDRDPVEQFDEYRKMAHQLFEGILVNNKPVWIETQKFEEFKMFLNEHHFDVQKYMEGIDHSMDEQTIESKSAKQVIAEENNRRQKRLDKEREKAREKLQKQQKKKEDRSL